MLPFTKLTLKVRFSLFTPLWRIHNCKGKIHLISSLLCLTSSLHHSPPPPPFYLISSCLFSIILFSPAHPPFSFVLSLLWIWIPNVWSMKKRSVLSTLIFGWTWVWDFRSKSSRDPDSYHADNLYLYVFGPLTSVSLFVFPLMQKISWRVTDPRREDMESILWFQSQDPRPDVQALYGSCWKFNLEWHILEI